MQHNDVEEQGFGEFIGLNECNAFFFMKSGGFLELVRALDIMEEDLQKGGAFNKMFDLVVRNDPQHAQTLTMIVHKHNFKDRLEMARAIKACKNVQSHFTDSVEQLTKLFIEEGIPAESAGDEALVATINIVDQLYMDRDEEIKLAVPVSESAPVNAVFDQIFK